jgi:hypothetical protein
VFLAATTSWKDEVMIDRRTVLRNGAAVTFGGTVLGVFGAAGPAHAEAPQQRADVVRVLKSYERSLNASDVAGVARLYTDDAVVLAPGAPSAVGIDAVRAAYTGIFQAIDLDLTFEVA